MSIENQKKNELSDEQLEGVSGGDKYVKFPGDISKYSDYTVFVDKYSGVIGRKYLFKGHGGNVWVFGTLYNSYEAGVWPTVRTHDVYFEDCKGFESFDVYSGQMFVKVRDGGTREINGDYFDMYAKA